MLIPCWKGILLHSVYVINTDSDDVKMLHKKVKIRPILWLTRTA